MECGDPGFILFYLFYLNELIYESPWNSAQHVASATEVFAAVAISAATFTGGEGTCPVTQKVAGQAQAGPLKASCCPGEGSMGSSTSPISTKTLLLI